ncbi:MarR family winged helix-turn-helix transcriptional regulator [Nocardia coffeae]|uniref:MarR family winged helix-turn-helix transcriptional regulator n=1 Tax=Nocardia coffeae TaxID=2873381 RepID=UPI0027E06098|nr:MarR family transcriptional regulator [Nocardia coffeae]
MTDQLALDQQLCFALYSASRSMTAVYRPKLEAMGLTYPQYLVMLALWEQREGRSVGELCAALGLDSGTLSPLLKRLEAAGLVTRNRSAADERRVEIELTEPGRRLRAKACGLPAEIGEAAGMSSEDIGTLYHLLQRLNGALSANTAKEN